MNEKIQEALEDSIEQIKRADHLIYVSLKYTRTVDVFKNIFERLIATFDCLINGMLQKEREDGKIREIPESIKEKCEKIKEINKSEELAEFINFYMLLRRLNKAEYTKRSEFRKHVTMTATMDAGKVIEVNIDVIHEYYDRTKTFIKYVKDLYGEPEQ